MSNGDFIAGDATPSPGDTQAALDALGQWSPLLAGAAVVLGLVSTPPAAEPAPTEPLALLDKLSTDFRHSLYAHLIANGTWSWWATVESYIADAVVFGAGLIPAFVLWAFEALGPPLVSIGLKMIDQFRKKIDVDVAQVAVLVLNELLGTNLAPEQLPTGEDVGSHIGRAQDVGGLYIRNIMREITPGTDLETVDGLAGVARFTGLIVNFGVATALLGLAGEIGTGGFIKNFRLIGEQVSSGLGLSKQMRIAIKPLMKTVVATPYQWELNQQFHPQRFSLAEVVNQFTGATMDHDTVVKDLELQGWSPDRAEQLLKLHQRKLTPADAELLVRWKFWEATVARDYVTHLGYPEELSDTVLSLEELRRQDARVNKLIDAMEANVVDGHMTTEDFNTILDTLPLGLNEKALIQQTVQLKQKAPHKSLTFGEIQAAFEQGLITLDDLDTLLVQKGFSGDEEAIFRALTLLKFAQFEEARKVAQFAYDKKVRAAKAKNQPIPPPPAILAT